MATLFDSRDKTAQYLTLYYGFNTATEAQRPRAFLNLLTYAYEHGGDDLLRSVVETEVMPNHRKHTIWLVKARLGLAKLTGKTLA